VTTTQAGAWSLSFNLLQNASSRGSTARKHRLILPLIRLDTATTKACTTETANDASHAHTIQAWRPGTEGAPGELGLDMAAK
jgi:hypothetical protein